MSDIFEKTFGAVENNLKVAVETPISATGAQATITQGGLYNANNAAMQAIKDAGVVQQKAAANADIIQLQAAEAQQATATAVTDISLQGVQAVTIGRDALKQESLDAINKQKELSKIQAEKPNGFLHPVRWVADTLHANKLEDQIQGHAEAVQVYNRNINNVVASTNIQVEELLEQQNLTNSAALRLKAAQLNQGLAAEQVAADTQTKLAAQGTGAVKDAWTLAKGYADWAQAEQRIQTDIEQARNASETNRLRQLELERDIAKTANLDGAIKQAARAYRISQGMPDTQANIDMSITTMRDMQSQHDPRFPLWSKVGALGINSSDVKSLNTAVVQKLTVGEARKFGVLTNNASLVALGGNQINQLTQQNEQQLLKASYEAAMEGKTGDAKMPQAAWEAALNAKQRDFFKQRAIAMATNVVENQSTQAYLNKRTEGKDVGQDPISLTVFKSASSLSANFGLDKKTAAILADPKVQVFLANKTASAQTDKKTAQLAAIVEVLEKNKVANPYGVAAKIGGKIGKTKLDTDLETQTLGEFGLVSSGAGVVNFKGKSYKLDSAVDLQRMVQEMNNKVIPSVPAFVGGKIGDMAGAVWNVGANVNPIMAPVRASGETAAAIVTGLQFERDKEYGLVTGNNPAIPLLFGTGVPDPKQAALEASQFTPAGHAPQVSGGVPATALSEADKLFQRAEAERKAAKP